MNLLAYGSLMSRTQLEMTLGRPAILTKCIVPGVSRVFNAPFDGYAYLNLKFTAASSIEAATFTINPSELTCFNEREAGSRLIEVLPDTFAFVWPDNYTRKLSVPRSYVALCFQAAAELGIDLNCGLVWPAEVTEDLKRPIYF